MFFKFYVELGILTKFFGGLLALKMGGVLEMLHAPRACKH